ncbi:MAG: M28 family metallopeptidase [Armatimonadota bacterium]|nr:M28 family metallopeptidase [Armatimonadota bacterium]MDR7437823.1 M28 family metallopeptidase [Armatimonadota bacterium]MDR7473148.1 M28 family metallopeptidase [Armatimonadota bacterium]MDR7507624.1 M28 family metallopeptidase [Armatimonadota bacterium]MDR7509950.1 M28 family metallopeptidase [Armatimonadota bacterium]
MRAFLRTGLWVLLLSAVLAAAASAQAPDAGVRALAHVRALAALGPRVAGSLADRQAADYIGARLRDLGYEVTLQAFAFPYFETRRVSLEVVSPQRVPVEARALLYSSPTSGVLTAEVVAAGRGTPQDVGDIIRGKIALVERGGLRFADKVANAARAGALAVVVYNNEPGVVVGTLLEPSAIPAVIISQADGRRVLEWLRSGPVVVALLVDTVNEQRQSANVVGSLPGASGRRLVVGGHYDSVEGSPGANDNASGVAAALEVARLLRDDPPPLPVEIVAFGAEELGLYGSRHYARSPRLASVAGMVNLDMVGVGERLLVGNTTGDTRLVDAAVDAARRLGIPVTRTRLGASDHTAFEAAGVPAVFLHWTDDPRYHSPQDTPEHIQPDRLDAVIRIAVAVAHSRAVGGPLPTVPQPSAELAAAVR